MSNTPGGGPERLDSWKAIADYLGRDAATVRRWEKSLHLPVRRLPGGRGRSVFAFRAEIDEWLKAAPAGTGAAEAEAEISHPAGTSARRWLWPAAAALALTIGAVGLWHLGTPTAEAGAPDVELLPTGVVARGADGTELWRFPFAAGSRAFMEKSRTDGSVIPLPRDRGFIVGTTHSVGLADEIAHGGELLWLTAAGQLRHRLTFDDRIPFADRAYGGPWTISDYRLSPELDTGRVAVAARHFEWWPSLVTVLDDQWQPTQKFVNAGWVERVAWLGPDRLMIAGFFNPLDGGMVALLDPAAMNGQSPPTDDGTYRCTGCGSATAIRYAVLPRSEINRVTSSPFNRAVVQLSSGRIMVRSMEEPSPAGHAAEALYEFSPALDLLSATYGDRYWDRHKTLEMAGRLDHPRERCPDRHGPPFIHMWEPATGWKKVAPPVD